MLGPEASTLIVSGSEVEVATTSPSRKTRFKKLAGECLPPTATFWLSVQGTAT
jgi:hypothetical protein